LPMNFFKTINKVVGKHNVSLRSKLFENLSFINSSNYMIIDDPLPKFMKDKLYEENKCKKNDDISWMMPLFVVVIIILLAVLIKISI